MVFLFAACGSRLYRSHILQSCDFLLEVVCLLRRYVPKGVRRLFPTFSLLGSMPPARRTACTYICGLRTEICSFFSVLHTPFAAGADRVLASTFSRNAVGLMFTFVRFCWSHFSLHSRDFKLVTHRHFGVDWWIATVSSPSLFVFLPGRWWLCRFSGTYVVEAIHKASQTCVIAYYVGDAIVCGETPEPFSNAFSSGRLINLSSAQVPAGSLGADFIWPTNAPWSFASAPPTKLSLPPT